MALGPVMTRMMFFFMTFAIVFPVFAYALTRNYDIIGSDFLEASDLLEAGIIAQDLVTHNVSHTTTWVYFAFNDSDYRVYWYYPDNGTLIFQVPLWPLGWWAAATIQPKYDMNWAPANFSTTYNWTRFTIDDGGLNEAEVLLTVYPEYDNMTQCITEGNVTLSIAQTINENVANVNLLTFGIWFFEFITGHNTYGMPTVFIWMIAIIEIIGVMCAILLIKEFIPLLP